MSEGGAFLQSGQVKIYRYEEVQKDKTLINLDRLIWREI